MKVACHLLYKFGFQTGEVLEQAVNGFMHFFWLLTLLDQECKYRIGMGEGGKCVFQKLTLKKPVERKKELEEHLEKAALEEKERQKQEKQRLERAKMAEKRAKDALKAKEMLVTRVLAVESPEDAV